jgi:ubiquinone/menaquinone biosynthesis C-methylase UbiE
MILNPAELLSKLLLRETSHVADLGAGFGVFTFPAADRVQGGKVYAVEIQKNLLSAISKKIAEGKYKNIEVISGDIEKRGGTKIADSAVDAVILSNTLFQIEDKSAAAEEIKRILKPGGKLLLVDWMENTAKFGPPKEHIIVQKEAVKIFENVGFTASEELHVGEYHYGMILLLSKSQ